MIKFWSIDYVDDEGEQCVRHAHLTDAQARALMEEFCTAGVSVTMHDLTPPQAVDPRTAAVLSTDGEKRQLGRPS